MKNKHPLAAKIPSLMLVGLICATGTAVAQTSAFYSDTGSGSIAFAGNPPVTGNLAAIGYDSVQYNHFDGSTSDGGTIGARPFLAPGPGLAKLTSNFTAAGLPATDGFGGALLSVQFFIFAEAITPQPGGDPTETFTIFDGLNGTGTPTNLTLSSTLDPGFFTFTLTAAQFAGGFSIAADNSLATLGLLNMSTEENLAAFQHPGVLATYAAVPEASVSLLAGVVGVAGLLRRRRS